MYLLLFPSSCGSNPPPQTTLTGKDVVQVPGQDSVQHSIQAHHADRGEEGELVPLKGAGLDVVPL